MLPTDITENPAIRDLQLIVHYSGSVVYSYINLWSLDEVYLPPTSNKGKEFATLY